MVRHIASLALTLFSSTALAADRGPVLKRIGEVIVERYVYKDVAERCVAHLMVDAARFDIDDPERFASAVTEELRRLCGDRHFELVVQRSQPAGAPAQDPNAWIEPLRRRNYDFNEVRRLAGNVGYLELRSCPPPEVAATAAAAAMNFLSSADAVILDLRRNSGGTGDMVAFLATYFFDGVTALTNTERRPQGTITQDRTLPWVPGPRMATQDLFILTSRATFSAAEGLAFALQSLKRATVVGEGTRGGANAGRYIEVSPEFRLFVSNAHATSAATGKSWDQVGVQPDIAVDAADALETAHAEAVRRLGIRTKDEQRKRELHWILQSLAAHVEVTDPQMRELAGEYERSTVRLHRGRLLYSYDGGPERPLIPIGEGLFAIDGVESRRVELRREGVLVVHSSDGVDEVLRRK